MHVLITGATGFIGSALVAKLLEDGHAVTVVTRDTAAVRQLFGGKVGAVVWQDVSGLRTAMTTVDGVINLAGENLMLGKWTPERKQVVIESRVKTTRALIEVMAEVDKRPAVLVNASAVGYYGPGDQAVQESSSPGSDFRSEMCVTWEKEARRAESFGVRVAIVRTGIVLGEGGGALAKMLIPFRLFMGGPVGGGKQWLPWVHLHDVVGIFVHALSNPDVSGPLNAVAPEAHTNASFSKVLGTVMSRPSWLPLPAFILRRAMGEKADMLLKGQRVEPVATLRAGYKFRYATLETALMTVVTGNRPGAA